MSRLLVQSPAITQLIEDESGRCVSAEELLGTDHVAAQQLYKRLHVSRETEEGRVLCALCSVPVYLCGMPDKEHYFFKHFQEDGSCPAITRGDLSEAQINALRYHNQRESLRHKRLKALLDESLRADPAFSTPIIEGTWKGKEDKQYRRPDVRSRFRDQIDVAFEVQLSTTFGRVMAEREVFYKREGGLLVWILGEFDYEEDRLMMQVVYANNNRNVFVANEATRDASVAAGALILECRWSKPYAVGTEIQWIPQSKPVRFGELTLEQDKQRVFYFNAEVAEANLRREIAGPPLWQCLEGFFLTYERFEERDRPKDGVLIQEWAGLQRRCAQEGVALPDYFDDAFRSLMRALYSAKHGKSVGWRYIDLWGAAHRVHDAHKPFLWLFMPALSHYGRLEALEASDRKGNWAAKVYDWHQGYERNAPAYFENHAFDAATRLAFPELAHLIPEEAIPF